MPDQQKYKAEENTQTRDLAAPIFWKMFQLKIFMCCQTRQVSLNLSILKQKK